MADTKISELPVATVIASPDVAPVVRNGVTMRADVSLFGGSFLSNETARVDPIYGDDSTGVIGDLTKPFDSTQGAIDAFELLVPLPSNPIIEIGGNEVNGFTTILPYLTVIGKNGLETNGSQRIASAIDGTIVMSATDGPEAHTVVLILIQCWLLSGVQFDGGAPDQELNLINSIGPNAGVTGNATGAFTIHGTSFNQSFSRLQNVSNVGGVDTSLDLEDITIGGTISSINGTLVSLNRCVVNNVAASVNELDLTDSFITGTNSAISTFNVNNLLFDPANYDFSSLPTSEPSEVGKAWIDTTGGFNIVKVHL